MHVAIITSAIPMSGYGVAVNGIRDILNDMKDEVGKVSVVNLSSQNELSSFTGADIALVVVHPGQLSNDPRAYSLIKYLLGKCTNSYLSVVWETDRLPEKWKSILTDKMFDGILTPSVHVHNLVKQLSPDTVTFYYPHFIRKHEVAKSIDRSIFRILYVGQYTERKGFDDAITAVTRVFSDHSDVELVMKYNSLGSNEIQTEELIRSRLQTNMSDIPDFKVYASSLQVTDEAMDSMYSNSDVLLFPSRGEGFGFPPCSAMSYGKPVIYVPWSATKETCDHAYNYPVEFSLDEAVSMSCYGYTTGMKYARPYMSSLCEALRQAYIDFKNLSDIDILNRAQTLSDFIDARYGSSTVKQALKYIIMNKGNNIHEFGYTTLYTEDVI